MPAAVKSEEQSSSNAIAKVCGVLRALVSREPLRLSEIADVAGLNRVTTLRILDALVKEGFVGRKGSPARYVFGYLPDMDVPIDPAPNDFAAWMEVWLGDRWWTFDPRNNQRRKGRILIGRGRDASDVAMVTTFGGPLLESMTVIADEVMAGDHSVAQHR